MIYIKTEILRLSKKQGESLVREGLKKLGVKIDEAFSLQTVWRDSAFCSGDKDAKYQVRFYKGKSGRRKKNVYRECYEHEDLVVSSKEFAALISDGLKKLGVEVPSSGDLYYVGFSSNRRSFEIEFSTKKRLTVKRR